MGNSNRPHHPDRPRQGEASCDAGRSAERRYRDLLAAIPDLMFRIRRDGTYLDYHAPDQSALWRRPEEFMGRRIEDVFGREFARMCERFIEETLNEGGTHTYEYRGWGEHAHDWWEVRLTPSGGDEVLVLTREITQRKRTEEELLRREGFLRSMFESSVDPLWDWDVVNDRAVFSPSWPQMLGFEPHEYNPEVHTWNSVLNPEDEPHVRAALEKCLRGDTEQYEAEYRVRHRDGHWIWAYSRGRVIERGPNGEPLRMVGSIRDMTERHRAEEEVHRSEERQRVLLRELDHRVRNNLASLVALIDISSRGAKSVADMASSMRSRVQAMSTTHVLLTRSHLAPLDVRRLIAALIPSEMTNSVELVGPEVLVSTRQSTALGMVVQEILTNSMKYGSLSALGGRVEARWRVLGDEKPGETIELELSWKEVGGPAIRNPGTPGVGTTLISGLVRAELRGTAELRYPESGASHRLVVRLDSAKEDPFRR